AQLPEEVAKFKELAKAYAKYEELKVKNSVMDFSDLISNTLRIFRERPNVLKSYQSKFKHILIDEFQDTNYAQNHLAIMLAGDDQSITAVADDDQSIYRWRGAAVYNVLDFEKHFKNTKIITLNQNYRSSQSILDHSYKLIQNNNPDRLEVKANVDKKLVASNEELVINNKELETRNGGKSSPRIRLISEETVEDEAELVSREIEKLIAEKPSRSSHDHPIGYSDVAILVRANNHAEPFTRALARHGIPFQFLGPGKLFRQNEVKDLIAYCKAITDINDSQALYRVLSMPNFSLSGRDLTWLNSESKKLNLPLFRVIEKLIANSEEIDHGIEPTEIAKLEKLIEMIKRHMDRLSNTSPGEILYYFLEDTGLLLGMRDPQSEYEARRVENISAFFNRIKTYEVQYPEGRMADFVDYLDFLINAGESPLASQIDWSETDAVKILTVHSAKGLEFDTVFMINLVNLRFPTINRKDQIPIPEELIKEPTPTNDPHVAEERRLFYVGMTRAKRNLYFTAAKFYHDSETARPKKISPFVAEALGDELEGYKVKGLKVGRDDATEAIDGFKPAQEDPQPTLPLSKPLKINYLSYSQIETFDTCPLHYKLDYILKVPKLPSGALSFGNSIHESLRDVYGWMRNDFGVFREKHQESLRDIYNWMGGDFGVSRAKLHESFDQIYEKALEFYEHHWSPIGFDSKAHEVSRFEDGKKILEEFLRNDLSKSFKIVELEKPFTFHLAPDLKIGGRIDRINKLPDGKLEIIDYKTGQLPEKRELEKGLKGLQLSIYAMALTNDEVMGVDLKDCIFSFHYLEAGERISIERTEEDLREAKEMILDYRSQMEKSNFACGEGFICQRGCEYNLFCK
ncbi:ATP-dependent helicase, partial [candidate division WWE3 bacterium]|nr:ATP-dependent helicase [candidate division WWE3 bacterium]